MRTRSPRGLPEIDRKFGSGHRPEEFPKDGREGKGPIHTLGSGSGGGGVGTREDSSVPTWSVDIKTRTAFRPFLTPKVTLG